MAKKFVPSDVVVKLQRLFPGHYTRVQPTPNTSPNPPQPRDVREELHRTGAVNINRPNILSTDEYQAAVRPKVPKSLGDYEFKTVAVGTLEELVMGLAKRIQERESTNVGGN